MFTGDRKKREMDWQLFAGYFTVKSTNIFCSLLIWITVGPRLTSTALPEGASGGCLNIFSLSSNFSFFFLRYFGRWPDID